MKTWLAILGVAAATYLLRASFVLFADPHPMPRRRQTGAVVRES